MTPRFGRLCQNISIFISLAVIQKQVLPFQSSVRILSWSGFAVDLEPITGALGVRCEYTLDGMPVHRRAPWTQTFIIMGQFRVANPTCFWEGEGKQRTLRNSTQTVMQAQEPGTIIRLALF